MDTHDIFVPVILVVDWFLLRMLVVTTTVRLVIMTTLVVIIMSYTLMIHCGMDSNVFSEDAPCCTHPNMPWFNKTLSETTTEDIELRVCGDQLVNNEDTPLQVIEIFVR